MKSMKLLSIVALLAFTALSCSKDEDTTPPVITITSPAEGAILQKGHTYPVAGTVTDDTELKEINAGGVIITTFDSATKHVLANINLPIDANAAPGNYSSTFTATDKAGNKQTKVVNYIVQ